MKAPRFKKYRGGKNDCLRQCVARLTGRQPSRVPHFVGLYGDRWSWYLSRWCDRTGHAMFLVQTRGRAHWNSEHSGPWCAIGLTKAGGADAHATVVCNSGVVWDGGFPLRRCRLMLLIWKRKESPVPYKVVKAGKGFKVKNTATGQRYSKKPMPKARAERQLGHLRAAGK